MLSIKATDEGFKDPYLNAKIYINNQLNLKKNRGK